MGMMLGSYVYDGHDHMMMLVSYVYDGHDHMMVTAGSYDDDAGTICV